jgi:ribokinase
MTRVGVVGHVEWVDFVPIDRFPERGDVVHADTAFSRAAGGGGVAAAVIADLGADITFFTALGSDTHGEAAVKQIRDRGAHEQVAWRKQPTRRAVTLLEEDGERTIITIGERLEPLGSDQLDWQRLRDADSVYLTAGDRAALVHAHQAKVVVASPRARHVLMGEGPRIDALVFSVRDPDESRWAHQIAPRTRILVGTDGAAGGRWWGESEGHWSAVKPPGPPRDSYGCGDSFAAGFTFGLGQGLSIGQAAELGARLGAECLARIGAP